MAADHRGIDVGAWWSSRWPSARGRDEGGQAATDQTHELSSTVTAEVEDGRLVLWRENHRDGRAVGISLTARAEARLLELLLSRRAAAGGAPSREDGHAGPGKPRP